MAAPSRAALLGAPVRTPRVSRLRRQLELPPKAAEGAAALGLGTIENLLEHVPRARREARTVAALSAGETATVLVEVRSIAARPVRRRGMRPLVEATVADATGPMQATFFNQPWLAKRYEPGTRLVLHGKYEGRGRFRVANHATTEEAGGRRRGGLALRGERRALEHADPGAHRSRAGGAARRRRAAAGKAARAPAPRRAGRGARGDALRRGRRGGRARARAARLRGAAVRAARAARPAGARGLGRGGARAGGAPSLTARWLEHELPFALTADQLAAIATLREELAGERPTQRLLMGEVGSGKTVVALFAMLRAVEHGFQAALMAPTETLAEQHFATIQRLLGASR
jgi:ATP-dependent DNA helicase RecG